MIVQKQDKKKIYISIGILVLIFGAFIYFVFSPDDVNEVSGVENIESISIVKKYKNLREIDSSLFNDERFKSLNFFVSEKYTSSQKGNPNPFVSK